MTDLRKYLNIGCLIAIAFLAGGLVTGKGCDVTPWFPPTPPVVVPVVDGPRDVLIVHETATDGPSFARLKSNLRSGAAYDYLKSKGHTLLIQDPDDGSPVIKQWQAEFTGLRMPAILISAKGKLLLKKSLSDAADETEVMDLIKTQEAK